MKVKWPWMAVWVAAMTVMSLNGCGVPFQSKDVKHVSLYSNALHKTMNVDIYLPPGYSPNIKYPVLYLLHGKDGDENSWMDSVHVNRTATTLINNGQIKPLIIVSPEIDNGYGINTSSSTYSVNGYSRGRYADFITQDLIQYIDAHYSVITSSQGRFIGGLSMGGFAALHAAFTHQDLYSKVGVMSAALWNGGLPESLSWIYPTPADQASRDPITIAKHTKVNIPVYIIEGKSDPFYASDVTLAHELEAQHARVQLMIYPGQHNYDFWSGHAGELLQFLDR